MSRVNPNWFKFRTQISAPCRLSRVITKVNVKLELAPQDPNLPADLKFLPRNVRRIATPGVRVLQQMQEYLIVNWRSGDVSQPSESAMASRNDYES